MIIVTGAAGFIGSCLVSKLNAEGFNNLILVDDFSRQDKAQNLAGKRFVSKVDRKNLFDWIDENQKEVEFIHHIGARTDTTEKSVALFEDLNVSYTKAPDRGCYPISNPDCICLIGCHIWFR